MVAFKHAAAAALILASIAVDASPVEQRRSAVVIKGPKRQTVHRRDNTFDVEAANREVARVKAKHGGSKKKPSDSKRGVKVDAIPPFDIQELKRRRPVGSSARALSGRQSSGASDALTNSQDSLYYGNLEVGTPAQTVTIDFDTGSADLLIPTTQCQGSGVSGCSGPLFDTGASSTYISSSIPFEIQYGDESGAQGTLAKDTVSVAGLGVQNQVFAAVTLEDFNSPNSGLLGMGFQPLSVSGYAPYFQNLASSGALASNIFSFYLSSNGADGSELCLGCTDSTKYTGSITYSPLDSSATQGVQYYWSIAATGMSVSGTTVTSSFAAVIDTGTTLVYVPTAVANALHGSISGAQSAEMEVGQGFWAIPCDTAGVAMVFNGQQYAIQNENLVVGTLDALGTNMCISGIVGQDIGNNLAIVGDVFLRSWYSVYDLGNSQIGFAQAV